MPLAGGIAFALVSYARGTDMKKVSKLALLAIRRKKR
jgi:hypothetical protein